MKTKNGKVVPEVGSKAPEGVINESAYHEYVRLSNELHSDANTKYQTSIEGLTINLLASKAYVLKWIAQLPDKEQGKIIKAHEKALSLRGKVSSWRKKAYGASTSHSRMVLNSMKHKTAEMVELFGRYYTDTEVHQVVIGKWGMTDISIDAVRAFRKENIDLIKQRQEEYRRDFSDIRLGYKRGRLEELSYMYRIRKTKFVAGNHGLDDSREMRAIIEQIRKEVEGDKLVIDANFNIHQDQQIEMHVYNNLLSSVSIKTVIIARVAARLNVPPERLIARLTRSFYAKFTGFTEAIRPSLDDIKLAYPSEMLYDFSKLEQASNEMRTFDKAHTLDADVVADDKFDEASNFKAKLLSLLSNRKTEMITSHKQSLDTDDNRNNL